ncbi:MAG: hypothetical protein U1E27_09875, partial [Kiritimatiellia bacterium]|nr:hypothetical protein [Kiritimatiellia bacterium]
MKGTPREQVERVLAGGHAERAPFTMYESKVIPCAAERQMRNRGLCIVHRMAVYQTLRPNVREREIRYTENGRVLHRREIETPSGRLASLA